ncbi:MAG: hypothetical protein ACT4OF_13745 [Caulobacteraceae bacterium]
MRALILALALAACSSAPEELPPPQLPQRAGIDPIVAARAEGVVFRALGHAPDFVLQIYRDDRITLTWDAHHETFPKPEPMLPRWNGEIYETQNERHTLRVEVERYRPCADPPVGGETRSITVIVTLDGGELRGCGQSL